MAVKEETAGAREDVRQNGKVLWRKSKLVTNLRTGSRSTAGRITTQAITARLQTVIERRTIPEQFQPGIMP
ncbi:hypothetical protein F3I35_08565 [Pantoea sp. Bo_7]|nr:hypothetical protein F3I35_08565 [Pantoea sp. Bo_7]KAA6093377.1 hypothetical protein F3I22_08570 [Pantoea sp. Bo_10]